MRVAVHEPLQLMKWEQLGVSKETYDWIRFTRPGNFPHFARRPLGQESEQRLLAELARCSAEQLEETLSQMRQNVEATAQILLGDPHIANLDRITSPGARIVAVGDSITADRVGWAEILGETIKQRTEGSASLINCALAGSTSTDTVERIDTIETLKPDVVLLMIGTNDARSQRLLPGEPLVSTEESRRNLQLIIRASSQIASRTVLLTPPPLFDEPSRRGLRAGTWNNSWDGRVLLTLVDEVRSSAPFLIDLVCPEVFNPRDQEVMDEDGIHPTHHGHIKITKTLLRALGGLAPL
jgi:lysophospholipase L1-like esterase